MTSHTPNDSFQSFQYYRYLDGLKFESGRKPILCYSTWTKNIFNPIYKLIFIVQFNSLIYLLSYD